MLRRSAPSRMSITPEDNSPGAYVHAALHSLDPRSEAARCQERLMAAITAEHPDVDALRSMLATMQKDLKLRALRAPAWTYNLRTPLMAAAATGSMPIVGALLAAFGHVFSEGSASEPKGVEARSKEMARQLEMRDIGGMTLLMHASCGGSSAVFLALSEAVLPSQSREVMNATDATGMTILHHAVKDETRESVRSTAIGAGSNIRHRPPDAAAPAAAAPAAATGEEGKAEGEGVPPAAAVGGQGSTNRRQPGAGEAFTLHQRLPVIQSVLEFAKAKLWMPEYRKLLQARDARHQSVFEHAIMSGHKQIFETVFDAIREDIHDEEIALMLDPGFDLSHAKTALSRALESQSASMAELVREKTRSLKSDLSKRTEDSTVTSKIQAFIPGNLVVIFQLLLPEFDETSNGPLYLLLALCVVAPIWSWGAMMSAKRDPETKNTRARQTASKYILSMPAMWFWGVGTSKIGTNSLSWAETTSAAALAVATIIIPALDTFFSSRGARATVSVITIWILDLKDGKKRTRMRSRSNQLYGQDEIGNSTSRMPRSDNEASVGDSPRPLVDAHTMEWGGQPPIRIGRAGQPNDAGATLAHEDATPRSQGGRSHADSIWGEEDDAKVDL